jgi:glycerate dehydrogenase
MRAVFLDRSTIDLDIELSSIFNLVDDFVCYPSTFENQVVERANDFDIVITNKVQLSREILTQLPQLKLVCITATGTNNIDLVAADELNIQVKNVAGYSTASVSQHVFAYLLNYINQVNSYLRLNQSNPWDQSKLFCQFGKPINELSGLKIGIVGYGTLGKSVANIAKSFGMTVLISERKGAKSIRQNRISFEQLLSDADVVSLHCPLTQETKNLFDKVAFDKMKTSSVLINTARGPVVNSRDLAIALRSGKIAHAIIDVLEVEPPELNHPLLDKNLSNISLTHHIAWGSLQAQQRLMDSVADNIRAFIESN